MPIRTLSKVDLMRMDEFVRSSGSKIWRDNSDHHKDINRILTSYNISMQDIETALRQEYITNNLCVSVLLSSQ